MNDKKILIVEDEQDQALIIHEILRGNGFDSHYVDNAEEAFERCKLETYSIIISDWRLKDNDGLWLLKNLQTLPVMPYFILATAYGSIQHAVEAIKLGASDYLTKPYSKSQLIFCAERAIEKISLTNENLELKSELKQRNKLVDMIGSSKPMQKIFQQVEKVASTNATIHISGESGTGKELAARALHILSDRKNKPFIVINCGAIPEGLAEAELFGAEKGSYTGSTQRKIGSFEAADGGTVFLDEVAELSSSIQTKLLRVLQESCITRIGSTKNIPINVRIISATHKSLNDLVTANKFREDLLYRLNVIPLKMPALRDRIEDIPSLLQFFNDKHSKTHNKPKLTFSDAVLKILEQYSWPGNVRELSHSIERIMLLSDTPKVTVNELYFLQENTTGSEKLKLPRAGLNWQEHEKDFYKQALDIAQGNKKKAAKLLGLTYKSFLYRLEKFLISD